MKGPLRENDKSRKTTVVGKALNMSETHENKNHVL
jgi:hypothetical protein